MLRISIIIAQRVCTCLVRIKLNVLAISALHIAVKALSVQAIIQSLVVLRAVVQYYMACSTHVSCHSSLPTQYVMLHYINQLFN